MRTAVAEHNRHKSVDADTWNKFSEKIFYHRSEFDNDEGYQTLDTYLKELDNKLGTRGNRIFYFSTPPSHFPLIVEKLSQHSLIYDSKIVEDKWSRFIIEKPFGHDAKSARKLQHHLLKYLNEEQMFRIDHYLGKETVQNLLVFRFANSIFESLWNNKFIDHVQITSCEDIGIGTRGNFFEEAGLLRDTMQNHIMQLLCLVAMEPPHNLDADAVRDEKVKVLRAIRPLTNSNLHDHVVLGQYAPGFVNSKEALGYRQEADVSKSSPVETYVALELFIDNWRWAGVPFYLRGGKRLPKRVTEIAITFKDVPGILFHRQDPCSPNVLTIRIQPDEGISLNINCKVPGLSGPIQPVKMNFLYGSYFGLTAPDAYERLICDCMSGDSTLFARGDEVIAAWDLLNPILNGNAPPLHSDFPNYAAGSWGPNKADDLLSKTNRSWRLL
jgi:glucose-6-phosphate 1-dehydrogenase